MTNKRCDTCRCNKVCDHYHFGFENCDNYISEDCVEVVRCRDCRYYQNHPNGLCYLHTEPYDNSKGYKGEEVCVEPNDFCSYGERRKDDKD